MVGSQESIQSRTVSARSPGSVPAAAREPLPRVQELHDALHDLRSALVAVRGYSRLLIDERAGPVNAAQREHLAVILDNAERMVGALERASLAVEEPGIEKAPVDLRELCRECLDSVRHRAETNSISIVENYPESPCLVMADRERIALVVFRILANTLRNRKGREIVVEIRRDCGEISALISGRDGLVRQSGRSDPALGAVETPAAALFREILEDHGGRITASIRETGWTATLVLPEIPSRSATSGGSA